MARPEPTILLEYVEQSTYVAEQVLETDAVYAVFYDNVAINLRTINKLINYPGPRYKKVNFSNPGHAINLAERLNRQFKTDKFSVHKLIHGERIF
jgi:hypothetical protein